MYKVIKNSDNLGWHDASFEYYTRLSYYALWEQTKKRKYKSKAKKVLKLSKKHGFVDAKTFLDKYF